MHIKKKYRCRPPQTGEAGFTLIEMVMVIVLASILGFFVFGILSKCIVAQMELQVRKESNDDAIRSMDKVNRELRESYLTSSFYKAENNKLQLEKTITSCADDNLFVMYIRTGDILRRLSKINELDSWGASGVTNSVMATNVKKFNPQKGANTWITIQYEFEDPSGNNVSEWVTNAFCRNE